ncbi:MAG: glycosyltransferase family 2 protein [Calditrichaeota bacterium]|nr:glycosyltransferase family 2 protein [Calditrichota bacterium]
MKLSITIIGHNESSHLKELLPQLNWADEIVYVDCESADDSLEIARRAGCRCFQRPNNPNLNVNKAFAVKQATGDWIFYLDPDERIPPALAEEIREVIQQPGRYVAFQVNRRNHYFGRWLRYGSQYPDVQLRLFRKGHAYFPQQHVHEKLVVRGRIGHLQQDMLHYPYQTISQYFKKFDFYTRFEAHYLLQQGVRITAWNNLRYLFWIPFGRFFRRYFIKMGFRDGLPGFFACTFDAMNVIVRYLKLWELYKNRDAV